MNNEPVKLCLKVPAVRVDSPHRYKGAVVKLLRTRSRVSPTEDNLGAVLPRSLAEEIAEEIEEAYRQHLGAHARRQPVVFWGLRPLAQGRWELFVGVALRRGEI